MFGTSDFAPNSSVPMHRTLSVDYAIIMSGEIVLKLDGGEERTVKAGEYIVQRGTNHEWHNRTNEWCRAVFVGFAAEPVKLADGTLLEETVFKIPPPQ